MAEIIQTERQKQMANRPSRLEVLREYEKRGALDRKYKDELRNLEAGELGEKLVLKYLNDYGEPHWKVIRNLWLEYHTTFECDLLLLTSIGLQTIEIKHYTGRYELKHSQWSCNGTKRASNPVNQSQKVLIHFQNLMNENRLNGSVDGKLVFTGPHFDVSIVDKIEGLEILKLSELRNNIYEIARDKRNSFRDKMDIERVLRSIQKYETDNPYPAENLYEVLGEKLQKGVLCCHCGSFNVNTNKTYMTCSCGMQEPREMAIVRTICEYSVIHFEEDITTNAIYEFCDGAFTKPTIATYLDRYFERFGNGRNTKYKRISRPFMEVFNGFGFTRECKFICKNLHEFNNVKLSAGYYYNNSI